MPDEQKKTMRPDVSLKKAIVYTTIGDGVTLGVNDDHQLIIEDAFVRMSLGRFTVQRLDNMKGYLEQLRPHAVEA